MEYEYELDLTNVNTFVAESIKCNICYSIIWDNIQCQNCLTLFCNDCYRNYVNSIIATANQYDEHIRLKCPYCRLESRFTKNLYVEKLLNHLYIKCQECSQKVLRQNIDNHLDICLGKPIDCYLCDFSGRTKAHKCTYTQCKDCNSDYLNTEGGLANHRTKCPSEIVFCKLCNTTMERRELQYHQEEYCKMKELICLYCNKKVLRKDLLDHYEECDFLLNSCSLCDEKYMDFHNCQYVLCIKCNEGFEKKDLPDHYKICRNF